MSESGNSKKNKPYVLWLPSWYPTPEFPFEGDFVQRHARAAAICTNIEVIFVKRVASIDNSNNFEVSTTRSGNLTETIVRYSVKQKGLAGKILSYLRYRKLYRKYVNETFIKRGLPGLTHVHVAYKASTIARWVQRNWSIPYILTEHWTVYLPNAQPGWKSLSRFARGEISRGFKGALQVCPVSAYLRVQLESRFRVRKFQIIPNVVDHQLFKTFEGGRDNTLRLVHISGLNYQKRPELLPQLAIALRKANIQFELIIFADAELAADLFDRHEVPLANDIILPGEVPQQELAKTLSSADYLIACSRYETFGCVLIEANACGVPVIVTDIPVIIERVIPGLNGFVIPEEGLVENIIELIQREKMKKSIADKSAIAATTQPYSFEKVGQQICQIYQQLNPELFNAQN